MIIDFKYKDNKGKYQSITKNMDPVCLQVEKVFIGAVAATRTVTVSTTRPGLPFSDGYIPGATGVGGTRSGAEVQAQQEFTFDPNDKVIVEIINGSSAANTIGWKIKYYEED